MTDKFSLRGVQALSEYLMDDPRRYVMHSTVGGYAWVEPTQRTVHMLAFRAAVKRGWLVLADTSGPASGNVRYRLSERAKLTVIQDRLIASLGNFTPRR